MGFNKGISGFRLRGAGNYVRQKAYGFIDTPDPVNLSTLHAYWEADFGVTKDGADNISQVLDKSGNGRNAFQLTGVNQPTFIADGGASFSNRPVMRFDGTQFLDINDFDQVDYNNMNIFAVAKVTDFTTSRTIISHFNLFAGLAWSLFTVNTTLVRQTISEDGATIMKTTDNSTALLTTKAYLFSSKFDTASLKMSLNGVDESVMVQNDPMTQFFDSPALLMIGAFAIVGVPSPTMIGDIAAIVIAGDMTDDEIIDTNNFLINKYNPK